MRKIVSIALIFVGVFLLTIAVLAIAWVPGQVERTPLDVNSSTRLAGTATLYGPGGAETTPVKAISITHADSKKSTGKVVLFNSSSCLIKDIGNPPDCVAADDPQGRLIAAGTEVFATDRHTAVAVNDPKVLPASSTARFGLINKWPFDAQKKTYSYWDSVSQAEVDANYVGQSKLGGLPVYQYRVDVANAPIEITAGVAGKYTSSKSIWIDPRTGSIIKQAEVQERTLDNGDPVLKLDFEFTPATVNRNVADAKDSIKSLDLITKTVPIGAGIVGLLALAAGLVLSRKKRTGDGPTDEPQVQAQPEPGGESASTVNA